MQKINMARVILAGLVAGIVGNLIGFLIDGLLLGSQWTTALSALNKPEFSTNQIVGFNLLGLANGIFLMWLYAAIRPRYGSGPKTAIFAGLLIWVIGILIPNVAFMGIIGLFPPNLIVATTLANMLTSIVAALAGAALYKEQALQSMTARA
jgi:hypothetical protein